MGLDPTISCLESKRSIFDSWEQIFSEFSFTRNRLKSPGKRSFRLYATLLRCQWRRLSEVASRYSPIRFCELHSRAMQE